MSKKLNKNISMLRFPEFAGKWEIKKLGDICDCIVPGRNKPKTFDGNIPWITIPDIEHGRINVFSASLKISYEEAQSILRTKFEQVLGLKPSSCREQDLFF